MIFRELRIIEDPIPRGGAWNMAIDEALGEASETPCLRVYRWKEPTVSFGYFEKIAWIRQQRPGSVLVRRWTGGGLVDHGNDFTYSLIVPTTETLANCSRKESYVGIHRGIQRFLKSVLNFECELAEESTELGEGCFQKPVRGDLLFGGEKIAGAAQRRTRKFLLHQGSLQKIPPGPWSAVELAGFWSERVEIAACPDAVEKRAAELVETRYGTRHFLERF